MADPGFSHERVVSLALEAFQAWRGGSRQARIALLEAWRDAVARDQEALARLVTEETGKPISQSRAEVQRGLGTLRATAEAVAATGEEAVPYDLLPGGEGCRAVLRRHPVGPVLAITPFNFPVNLALHKLGPALGAGCSVVWKPCPQAPRTSARLLACLEEVLGQGLGPAGLVQGADVAPPEAEALALDPRIALVSFTGSERVGLHLRAILGGKPLVLELGGNAAVVVDAGVDAAKAAKALAPAAVASAGQSCCKAQRLYIVEGAFQTFADAFVGAVRDLPAGDPFDPRTVVGPLIDEATALRLDAGLDRALGAGAKALLRGARQGRLLPPAVLTGVPDEDPLCCEELFGPVTVLSPVADFEEGLARAAATRFGLRASVYTRDLGRWQRAREVLRAGCVLLNLPPTYRVDAAPFGGLAASGQGLEGPRWALEAFSEARLHVEGPAL
jgi:acyl-CoA reductase-like NAD-dependent aldehyde dehydrogenase